MLRRQAKATAEERCAGYCKSLSTHPRQRGYCPLVGTPLSHSFIQGPSEPKTGAPVAKSDSKKQKELDD